MLSRRVLIVAGAAALAGAARAAAPPLASPHAFRFEWLEGGSRTGGSDAHVDLGTLAARGGGGTRQRAIVMKRRVAVRIDGPGPAVRLSAALGAETPGCSVRVNGIALSTIPRMLDGAHRVGTAVVHQIEISIPANVPAGPFLSNIQWLAESH